MWTFKYPYRQLLSTRKRIELHAHAELFRGMHNERMVAFVGSGISLPYGRLNWGELTRILVMEVDALFRSIDTGKNNEARVLCEALRIAGGGGETCETDDGNSVKRMFLPLEAAFNPDVFVLELCADLCEALGKPNFLKITTARHFNHGPIGQFGARLILLDGIGENTFVAHWLAVLKECLEQRSFDNDAEKQSIADLLKEIQENNYHPVVEETHIFDSTTDPALEKYYIQKEQSTNFDNRHTIETETWKILEKAVGSLPENCFKYPLKTPEKVYGSLHRGLKLIAEKLLEVELKGIRIEQNGGVGTGWPDPIRTMADTLKLRRFITLNYDEELEHFFNRNREFDDHRHMVLDPHPVGDDGENRLLESFDGYRSKMTSVTLNDDMIGSLIDFSTLDEDDNFYVFHLHGRADKPEDIILTERDYQFRYLRDDASRTAFDEGLNTLFSGNDVLFLGVGMSEADLLQPLRQFMAQGERANRERDGTIAILNEKMKSGSSENDPDGTEREAIRLHTQFGVKSIFYEINTAEQQANIKERLMLEKRLKLSLSNHENRVFELKLSPKTLVEIQNQKALSDEDSEQIKEQLDFEYNIPNNPRDIRICRIKVLLCTREATRLVANSLDETLKGLAQRQKIWRQDWTENPGKRLALFRNWYEPYVQDEQKNKSVWIRQNVCHANEPPCLESGGLADNGFYVKLLKSLKTDNKLRSIERITGQSGVGKGQIVRALQFDVSDETSGNLKDQFQGCFFADARFSTEFNSVISALYRFLAVVIARHQGLSSYHELIDCSRRAQEHSTMIKFLERGKAGGWNAKACSWAENLDVSRKCFGRSGILKFYLELLRAELGDGADQILVCLSGLDRLVDKTGYGYNAMHRDFFKLLTSDELVDVPMKLVLIAAKPNLPIRYLSEVDLDQHRQSQSYNETVGFRFSQTSPETFGNGNSLEGVLQSNPVKPNILNQSVPLKLWNQFVPPTAIERDWLPGPLDQRAEKMLRSIIGDELSPAPALKHVIENNVSVHVWVQSLVRCRKIDRNIVINDLDIAASRHGKHGVIRAILRIYTIHDNEHGENNAARIHQEILRHLVYFTIPVERSVLANCPVIKKLLIADNPGANNERELCGALQGHLDSLFGRCLLTKIEPGRIHDKVGVLTGGEASDYRYTLHGLMRKTLAKKMGFDAYVHGEYSFFDVSLFSAQPRDLPSPDEYDYYRAGEILREFILTARDQLEKMFFRKNLDADEQNKKIKNLLEVELDSFDSISRRIRAGVNLVSGAFSIGVISRLESASVAVDGVCSDQHPFECYRSWLRGLLSAAIAVKHVRAFAFKALIGREPDENENNYKFFMQTPLYETETAWLYNERAVVSLIQGRLLDALPAFELARRHLEGPPWSRSRNDKTTPPMSSSRRVQLNQAIAIMEAGDVRQALTVFDKLHARKFETSRNNTSLTAHLAGGYLGLCNHLLGRLLVANDHYNDVLDYLKKNSVSHQRAAAIFRHHQGNLQRTLKKFKKGDQSLRMSINAAASARQMDIFHHASVSRAKMIFDRNPNGDLTNAQALIRNALIYAESMGVHALRIQAETVLGEILLSQQQYKASGAALTNAVALANKYGLLLRKISALELYAKLLQARGEPDQLCNKVFDAAKKFAEEAGYLLHTKRTVKRTSPFSMD